MHHTVASDVIIQRQVVVVLTPEERRHMRFEQIERFLHSDMSATQWTKLNHMHESTFYLWLARYRSEHSSSASPDPLQKKKQTTEWIALSKQDVANQTAIVATGNSSVESGHSLAEASIDGTEETDDVSRFSFISIQLNEATIVIPPGSAKADIENVIQTVNSL